MSQAFHVDLEKCVVALLTTHGGPIHSVYQFRRGEDQWIVLHQVGDDGLGKGRLRHLFLETCSAMGWLKAKQEGELQNLFTDWMNDHIADGLRTACGADGKYGGYDRGGWRFVGRYHMGESISTAWALALLQECPENVPVTVAYGSTLEEALQTLFDGRFDTTPAGTGWIVALLTHTGQF